MPDGDVISRSIRHGWRPAYAGLRGDATPEELAPRLLKALSALLRANGGIPQLHAYGSIIDARAAGLVRPPEALERVREVGRSTIQTPFSLLIARAIARCVAEPLSSLEGLVPGALRAAEYVCTTAMDVELFEKARPALLGERFPGHAGYDAFVAQCRACVAPGVARIAEYLTRTPSATGLRAAPSRRRAGRRSTAEMLRTSIL
jgi:hypothetical protein